MMSKSVTVEMPCLVNEHGQSAADTASLLEGTNGNSCPTLGDLTRVPCVFRGLLKFLRLSLKQ